jgi:DNA-binding Xre family transcriptional regulator
MKREVKMTKRIGINWLLRDRLEEHCIHSSSELMPLLAERGVHLGRTQCFRLVTQDPQRISTDLLAALCDILSCTPNDLIKIVAVNKQQRKRIGERETLNPNSWVQPLRTTIRRPHE